MNTGYRTAEFVDFDEEFVHPIEEEETETSEENVVVETLLTQSTQNALTALKERGALDGDSIVVGFTGDMMQARAQLPFSEKKRIKSILPLQIEDSFPLPISDLTYDFQVGSEADEHGEYDILIAGTPRENLAQFLAELAEIGIDPKIVTFHSSRLINMFEKAPSTDEEERGAVAIIDIGHKQTHVCICDENDISFMRQYHLGAAHFTGEISSALNWTDQEQSERFRQSHINLDPRAEASSPGDQYQPAIEACHQLAEKLTRMLNRTFHGHNANGGSPITRIRLCGGGTLIPGLPAFIAMTLGITTRSLVADEIEAYQQGAGIRGVGAMALARQGTSQLDYLSFNLRQDGFIFQGDFEFLKTRIPALSVSAVALIIAMIFVVITGNRAKEREAEAYINALCNSTEALFQEAVCSPTEVLGRLNEVSTTSGLIPEYSAYEIFRDISTELVDARDFIEVMEITQILIDVQRDIITIKGSTDSAANVDEIIEVLDQLECVNDIQSEQTTRNRTSQLFDFELQAKNTCT
jgi:type IV pilus assembly protein PilM